MVAALAIGLFVLVFVGVVVHEAGGLLLARRRMQRADEYEDTLPFIISGPPEDAIPPDGPVFMERPVMLDAPVPLQISSESYGTNGTDPYRVQPVSAAPFEPGATMVFARPSSHPLHLLPGHLEVISGVPLGDEIRLMGHVGEVTQITIGREMANERGVALPSPTVSRRHASLTFVDGQWTIANLSQTNPLILNNRRLASQNGDVPLADGDRIELGEVVLQFHAR